MKKLELKKMETIEGGITACDVVGGAWAGGIGYAFGFVSGGVGFLVGFGLGLVATAVCNGK